jgi:hypothetical protein
LTIDAAPTALWPPAAVATCRLARRPAGRHHVLDHQDAIVLADHEAAAQHQRAVLALGEDRAPRRAPARPRGR